jgi:hypothetical protein
VQIFDVIPEFCAMVNRCVRCGRQAARVMADIQSSRNSPCSDSQLWIDPTFGSLVDSYEGHSAPPQLLRHMETRGRPQITQSLTGN